MEVYAEYGAIGVIVSLFIMMIVNLMRSQKAQNEDLDDIRVHIGKMETVVYNVERRHEDMVKEMNDISDDLNYLKGKLNSK